jgi:hypothetical protein
MIRNFRFENSANSNASEPYKCLRDIQMLQNRTNSNHSKTIQFLLKTKQMLKNLKNVFDALLIILTI